MAAIIFDFDGTIADSFDYVADFLARGRGRQLDEEHRQALQGLSITAMARRLDYPWWRWPDLFFRGRAAMGRRMRHVEPFAGMPALLEKLHAEGHELFIVSSNTVRNVRHFLRRHNLHRFFLEVYGGVGLFGKAPGLRRLLRDQQFSAKAAVYIGDEARDIRAAEAAGMRIVAVTWGFAKPHDLARLRPTAVAQTPADLLKILEDI